MNLPLIDIVPRMKRMVSRPETIAPAMGAAALCGAVEGLALAAMLPAISSLASGAPVWGLGFAGWLVVFAALAALGFLLNYWQSQRSYGVALDFLHSIHRLVGDQVSRQPLGWFARPLAGRLSRMVSTELMQAGEIFAHMFGPLVSRLTSAAVVIVAAWFWNPLLGAVLTISAPVFVVITLVSTAFMRCGSSLHEPEEVNLANRIVEYAQCQGALRSCGRSDDFAPLVRAQDRTLRARRRAQWIESAGMLLSGMVTQGVVVALIAITGTLAVAGSLQPIPALAFIGLALRFTSTLSTITEAAMSLESRRPLLDALDEVLTAEPLPEPTTPTTLPEPGAIELEQVGFAYQADEQPVLTDVSLRVPAGTMVFQDVYLFDDTLEANVAIGREGATAAEIREAADLAGVTEIAERLPAGWASRVGEGGRALSGGERQRVAIARALLKRSPIVLLDEATSALDLENEANISPRSSSCGRRATLLVIAHRLDTIAAADQIVALDADGRVEAQGTHAELLAVGGTYSRFWDRLHRAQGWQLTAPAAPVGGDG